MPQHVDGNPNTENLYLRGPTSKQRDGLKITEGLEGERMIEEEKFKNRKKVFWSIDSESAVEAKQTIDR